LHEGLLRRKIKEQNKLYLTLTNYSIMAFIKIGISENVSLSKETGIVEDSMRIVLEINPTSEDLVQAMMEGRVLEAAKTSFIQFLPNMDLYGGKGKKSSPELVGEYMKFQSMLLDYGKIVASEEEAKIAYGGLKPFLALGISQEAVANVLANFNDDAFLKKVYYSLFELFSNFLQTIPDLEAKKMRHKFWRGSKKKTFSSIPKFNKDNVFVEPMTVPREETKLAWTVYELEKGLNSAEEVAADTSEQSPDAAAVFEAPIAAPIQPDLVGVSTIIDPTLIGSDEAAEQSPYVVEDTTTDMEAPMTAPQVTFDAPTPK